MGARAGGQDRTSVQAGAAIIGVVTGLPADVAEPGGCLGKGVCRWAIRIGGRDGAVCGRCSVLRRSAKDGAAAAGTAGIDGIGSRSCAPWAVVGRLVV